jgi:hypothetical protein
MNKMLKEIEALDQEKAKEIRSKIKNNQYFFIFLFLRICTERRL